jgi:hypothetical protein
MFKVVKLADSQYVVSKFKQSKHFSKLKDLVSHMLGLGVSFEEIEEGLAALERNGHNVADYGVNKTFIFSKHTDQGN